VLPRVDSANDGNAILLVARRAVANLLAATKEGICQAGASTYSLSTPS
jgi:hypothetical protein